MQKHTNFDEMYHDDEYISPEEREIINSQVKAIGENISSKENNSFDRSNSRNRGGMPKSI